MNTGLTPLGRVALAFFALLLVAAVTGCVNVKSAKEAHVQFGITGVFVFEKNLAGLKVDEKKIVTADTDTRVQVGLFEWKSAAKGVVLGISPPAPDKP